MGNTGDIRNLKQKLTAIGEAFRLPGKIKKIEFLKESSKSITYKVSYNTKKTYIFQKFTARGNASDIMRNVELATKHLASKDLYSMHFHHTNHHQNYILDDQGDTWRVKNYFSGNIYHAIDDLSVIHDIGYAIGSFQLSFDDFDATQLVTTLPGFHDMDRLLDEAVDDTEIGQYLESLRGNLSKLKGSDLPLRATHNNTSLSHFLFDNENKPFVIINLDYLMPAYGLYDLGHAGNSICCDKGKINLEKIRSYLRGYLKAAKPILSDKEIETIPTAFFVSAVEVIAVAYKKYKDTKQEKKLERAKKYISIAKSLEGQYDAIKAIVQEVINEQPSKEESMINLFKKDGDISKQEGYKHGDYMPIVIPHNIKARGGRVYRFFKRLFDIFASFFAIILLSPILLIVGILVKLTSKGPMIYVSKRVGRNGRIFNFYKFRSMYADAEKRLDELLAKNEVEGGITFKMKDDPRITPFGKFIRKTSLDELPQLFNILKGDMSVIGPRAGLPREVVQYPDRALDRLLVPQGLSGEWQAKGRSNTTFDKMISMDLEYIEKKCGFWYDIGLIFATIWSVVCGRGAE